MSLAEPRPAASLNTLGKLETPWAAYDRDLQNGRCDTTLFGGITSMPGRRMRMMLRRREPAAARTNPQMSTTHTSQRELIFSDSEEHTFLPALHELTAFLPTHRSHAVPSRV